MGKVLTQYLAGELRPSVYWAVGLFHPILTVLFLIYVVDYLVVIGMRHELLLSLGALPQLAAGAIGLVTMALCWGSVNKMIKSLRKT